MVSMFKFKDVIYKIQGCIGPQSLFNIYITLKFREIAMSVILLLITEKLKSTCSKQSNRFRLLLEWFYSGRWFHMRICQGNLKLVKIKNQKSYSYRLGSMVRYLYFYKKLCIYDILLSTYSLRINIVYLYATSAVSHNGSRDITSYLILSRTLNCSLNPKRLDALNADNDGYDGGGCPRRRQGLRSLCNFINITRTKCKAPVQVIQYT
ncbi:hypothetical protein AGLY_013814 [Aphis glycines]|uniref:Uncharacterized protein n=1 Tax=Aphis glycines TaxID=307491 RepID=A0A6G0T607_APHGL|nr:hypothetical protein AGLY_013814 [Aphis glycines]